MGSGYMDRLPLANISDSDIILRMHNLKATKSQALILNVKETKLTECDGDNLIGCQR